MRKPSLYRWRILVEPSHYLLAIPPISVKELPRDVKLYLEWGASSGAAKPAINAFGKHWYSHVYKQIQAKKPYGHVFLPDKIDPSFKGRGVYANYTEKPTVATKNFHIVRLGGEAAKALTAWFNSTPFLAILTLVGRRISKNWTRLLEDDYLKLPTLNTKKVDPKHLRNISKKLEKIIRKNLPPIPKQLKQNYRIELDAAIIEAATKREPRELAEKIHEALCW